jgi:HlyD family secretion protein
MKKIFTIIAAVLALSLFVGTGYFLWAKSRKPKTRFQTEAPKVATIIKKAVATGSVVPRREVEIKSRVSGIIEEIGVEPGHNVREGDLIARIRLVPDMVELNNARNRLTRAEINHQSAQRDYDRNQVLRTDGLVSESVAQQFESTLANAKAELDAARDNLDLIQKGVSREAGATSNTLVRSTIAGMILEVPVEVGNSVIESNTFNAGSTLATVADMDDMIFRGRVDESEVGKLKPGMTLLLTIGAIEEHRIEASLEYIAPKGAEQDGAIQFQIRAALKPQSGVLIRANYSANADIVLDRRDSVLAINESLLQFEGDKRFVEVEVAPQKFERREIQTGLSDGIQIEVLSGLTATDKVKSEAVGKKVSD